MSAKTPMRVRGKRSAQQSEKWNYCKQRKAMKSSRLSERSTSVASDSTATTPSDSRKRRRRDRELSRLEQLPTEILQLIFIFSRNVDLPSTSPTLASQLASSHLHCQLTDALLCPILNSLGSVAKRRDASRLMNSRFFTWNFFKDWIESESTKRRVLPGPEFPSTASLSGAQIDRQMAVWHWLHPDKSLLPPVKLLRPPFTSDKICMLRALTHDPKEPDLDANTDQAEACAADAVYHEVAREAYSAAILAGATVVIECLWHLGIRPETIHFRLAIVESDCKREVVETLVSHLRRCFGRFEDKPDVDFLDPHLWAWAERAQADGNKDGEWLLEILRTTPRTYTERRFCLAAQAKENGSGS